MNRLSIWIALSTTLLMLVACQPVLMLPSDVPLSSDAAVTEEATTNENSAAAQARLAPRLKPARILFIGNTAVSQNLGIGAHLAGIINTADPGATIETEYLSGHFGSLVNHSQLNAPAKIREGDWDAVVLEADMNAPSEAEQYYAGVRALDTIIDETGAETVLLVPWPFTNDPALADEFEEICERIGAEVDATLVPAGQAWQRMRERDADILLRDEAGYIYDLAVPGTYLTAFVLYHTLYGGDQDFVPILPVDVLPNPAEPSYSMEKMREKWDKALSEEDAALLQQVAWETVMDYEMGQ